MDVFVIDGLIVSSNIAYCISTFVLVMLWSQHSHRLFRESWGQHVTMWVAAAAAAPPQLRLSDSWCLEFFLLSNWPRVYCYVSPNYVLLAFSFQFFNTVPRLMRIIREKKNTRKDWLEHFLYVSFINNKRQQNINNVIIYILPEFARATYGFYK